jgi:hypothetical protein
MRVPNCHVFFHFRAAAMLLFLMSSNIIYIHIYDFDVWGNMKYDSIRFPWMSNMAHLLERVRVCLCVYISSILWNSYSSNDRRCVTFRSFLPASARSARAALITTLLLLLLFIFLDCNDHDLRKEAIGESGEGVPWKWSAYRHERTCFT